MSERGKKKQKLNNSQETRSKNDRARGHTQQPTTIKMRIKRQSLELNRMSNALVGSHTKFHLTHRTICAIWPLPLIANNRLPHVLQKETMISFGLENLSL